LPPRKLRSRTQRSLAEQMSRFASRFLLFAIFASITGSAAGCYWHITAASTNPVPSKLDWPAGLAMDPTARFLYLSNGNADLKVGSGSIMMVDLLRFDCAVDAFNGVAPNPACAQFPTKTDIALARDSHQLPTAGCLSDPDDQQIVDCTEDPFILSNATVRVGNFAGTMRLQLGTTTVNGVQEVTRRLYVSVRGDPSVTYADINFDDLLATPDAGGHIDTPGLINCFDDPASLLTRSGYDAATNTTTSAAHCDPSHLLQTYTCPGSPDCLNGDNNIPTEPFDLFLDQGTNVDGTPFSRLLVAHLSAGAVTLIDLLGVPYIADVSPPFFEGNSQGQFGTFGIARLDNAGPPIYYLTSDLTAALSTFQLQETAAGGVVVPGPVTGFSGSFPLGAAGRELIFDPQGQRAYMTQTSPPSVAVIDMRLNQPDSHGLPANNIVDDIPVCAGPSNMALRQELVVGPAGSPPQLGTKLYVVCFLSNQVMVVDPDTLLVEATILLGRGPNEIAFNFTGEETPVADRLPEPTHRRAYVSEYGESTIAVIDLDAGSPSENRVIARIGMPFPPPIIN
jgi:YVTN family beta-propeller protein